jgi:hypothetical protein
MPPIRSSPLLLPLLLALLSCGPGKKPGAGSAKPAAAVPAPPQAPTAAVAQTWLGKAKRTEDHGWIVVHLEGGAQERGYQHGSLLAAEIREVLRKRRAIWHLETAMDWKWLVDKTRELFTPRVDAENRAEIDGIVQGLASKGVASSRDEIVALNAWLELVWYWWPEELKKLKAAKAPSQRQSCSAFIATGSMTTDGRIVAGHNTWDFYPQADGFVVLDIVPDKGHRIFMQAQPGLVHSDTDFFVTDALIGTETTIGGFQGYDDGGIPEFVRMRRATQDASSIDEWCRIMKKGNNGGYANAWLLGDLRTREIARLELGLKNVALEKKRDGFFVGSNVAEDLRIARHETDVNDTDIRDSSVARRVRWHALMREHRGKIDRDLARQFLADHVDSYLKLERPTARTLCGHGELDPLGYGPRGAPYPPMGAYDAKVVDTELGKQLSFDARWGSSCGAAFDADKFLADHPQYERLQGLITSRPSQPWTRLGATPR